MATLAAVALIGLSGCWGGDEGAVTAQKTEPQRQAPAPPQAVQVAEIAAEYHYDPNGKPDPFRSFLRELARIRTADSATPLERFDLSQLAVKAVIWGNEDPRALVHDPSGKGYIVQKGAAVGKNDGRVVAIHDGSVVVKETYVDFEGQATAKDVELRLR
jgi:type IV pilus assembly protein PilP